MSKKTETAIYVIGILMLIATIAAECFISEELRKTDFVKQYMKPNVILYSAGDLYIFCYENVKDTLQRKNAQGFYRVY